jgi:signal transduction protein with GAF and PtsI domain
MTPPKHIGTAVAEGLAVPAGFTLPWNTTRSMADVWAEDTAYEVARITGAMGGAATKAKRQQRKEAA